MFKLPFVARSQPSQPQTQPFSRRTAEKASRLRGATVTEGLCPYCAVGCSQLIYTKRGQLIDIEGDPESMNRINSIDAGGTRWQTYYGDIAFSLRSQLISIICSFG